MMMRVRRYDDAHAFLARAEPWLLAREAENNLILGIARRLAEGTGGYQPPVYLAVVEDASGDVVGCAFRTPPYKLGLTRLPSEAVPLLVEDVSAMYDALPAVLGPEAEAGRFAELWTERHGGMVEPGLRQRIYELDRVVWPERSPAGRLRVAGEEDIALVTEWVRRFVEETGVDPGRPANVAAERVREGVLYLWDDGGPRSLAGVPGRTPHGVRVGYVYTPPELRGRGYASAAVAALSQLALDQGFRYCFLYTDLSNPTSNKIYQAIGYRRVCDVVDYTIRAAAESEG